MVFSSVPAKIARRFEERSLPFFKMGKGSGSFSVLWKKRLSLFFIAFLLLASASILRATEGYLDDPVDETGEKNYTELIAMERAIKEKLGLDPANAELYFKLAGVCSALFDQTRKKSSQANEWLSKSAAALEKTVMLRPGHKVALYNLGVVYKRQGRMEKAREELRRAIRACDPAEDAFLLTAAWMQIGFVYEDQGFFAEAEEAFLKAREYDEENEEIRGALMELKQKKAAAESGASSYDVMPMNPLGMTGIPGQQHDPTLAGNNQQQGLAQALPALGSMLSQKFSGQQDGGSRDNETF